MSYRLSPILLALAVWVGVAATSGHAQIETRKVSTEELERLTAEAKKYEFSVDASGALRDSAGEVLALPDLKKTLKKRKYDRNAIFVLWLDADASPEKTEPIVPRLSDYGVTKIVLRRRAAPEGQAPAPAGSPHPGVGERTLVLQGKPNPKSHTARDKFPNLTKRPANLIPQKLPQRVRYRFTSDEIVRVAFEKTQATLLAATTPADSLFSEMVIINAGAWQHFRERSDVGRTAATPSFNRLEFNGKKIQLEGMMLADSAEILALQTALRELITQSGGASVRALQTEEMDKWWTFIGFDIEEPTLVVETKDHRYRFILGFGKKGVVFFDELNGLP